MSETLAPPAAWKLETERRNLGRLEVRHLRTRLGRVVDIGPGGMRLRGVPWPALDTYGAFEVELHGMPEVLPLKVTVAWSTRPGVLTREIGLAFVDLSEHAEHALAGLFAACRDVHTKRAG
ncbi:MAG: PilZ domain-containing protein [Phycisphaerales bacterium]|nr:PilZ domain-containing protein [Phycisphaerales bacterium]